MNHRRTRQLLIPRDFWHRDDVTQALQQPSLRPLFILLQAHTGASQTTLAAAVGASQATINAIMTGRRSTLSPRLLQRAAGRLAMPHHARALLNLEPFVFPNQPAPDTDEAEPGLQTLTQHAQSGAFADALRTLRTAARLSQAALAKRSNFSKQLIGLVETRDRTPSHELAAALDKTLNANGHLIELAAVERTLHYAERESHTAERRRIVELNESTPAEGALDMNRRQFLSNLGLMGISPQLASMETLRQGLMSAHSAEFSAADEWAEISHEYARSFYYTPAHHLLRDLMTDLSLLQSTLVGPRQGKADVTTLVASAAHLASITAMVCASVGENRHALRWWRTARQFADRSQEAHTQMWVRGWEVSNGLYERRAPAAISGRAAEATALGGHIICAGTAGLYAGLAQTLASQSRATEALQALARAATITEQLPPSVIADENSMFGWPEVRLRHTESFVYTWLGDTSRAYAAQEQALRLYPDSLVRERAAMMLHRVACMIHDGDIIGAIDHANDVLDNLPDEHHTELVYAMGRAAIAIAPECEHRRQDFRELTVRLAIPQHMR